MATEPPHFEGNLEHMEEFSLLRMEPNPRSMSDLLNILWLSH